MAEVASKAPEKLDLDAKIAAVDAKIAAEGLDGNTESKAKEETTEQKPDTKTVDSTTKESDKEETTERKSISKRVQEGQAYNNRDRKRHDDGGKHNDRYPSKEFTNYRKNVKSDLTSQQESSDPVEIRKQVEFYFSDSNLLQDEFLYSRVDGPNNLPVPISIIHSFKRMRHFQPLSAVIAALKDSTTLEVVDNDACVKRKYPLPEEIKDKPLYEIQKVYEDKAMARSVYTKGFGDEEPRTQFDIEAFFAEFGPTNSVRLRRQRDKTFKGSVFVEFDSEESQKKFLALDPKPKWRGKDLLIKSKKQYCDDKVADIEAGRIKPNTPPPKFQKDQRGRIDQSDWKARREQDQKRGFKDRNDRSGGRRGDRGGRDRGRGRPTQLSYGEGFKIGEGDRKHVRHFDHEGKDEHNISVPAVRASEQSPTRAGKTEESKAGSSDATTNAEPERAAPAAEAEPGALAPALSPPTEASKKRLREDEDGAHPEESASKKVDKKDSETES